jgi:hypothetical protein
MVEHYPDHLSPQDYRERARTRAARSPTGIGAVVERVDDDRDGVRGRTWVCLVSDGSAVHYLDVRVPDVADYAGLPNAAIEEAVGRAAERLPATGRLTALLAGGLLELEPEDVTAG